MRASQRWQAAGANRRGPGHHERSGPDQDRDDVLRAGPDLFRPQSRLPDRGRLHGSPRRADPARLLHLDLRVLGLDHRQPGHGEAFFLSTSVHAALGIILNSDGKPADHTSIENPAAGNPGGFLGYATAWLEYQLRGNPPRPAPSPGRIRNWSEHQLARQSHQVSRGPAAKVPGLASTGSPANGEVARSRHRTPGSGKPRIAPADSTISRNYGGSACVLRARACHSASRCRWASLRVALDPAPVSLTLGSFGRCRSGCERPPDWVWGSGRGPGSRPLRRTG